jgi:predicted small secreted protein
MTKPIHWFLSAVTLSLALGLAGCNTMEGLGQDIENTGSAIEEEASD